MTRMAHPGVSAPKSGSAGSAGSIPPLESGLKTEKEKTEKKEMEIETEGEDGEGGD